MNIVASTKADKVDDRRTGVEHLVDFADTVATFAGPNATKVAVLARQEAACFTRHTIFGSATTGS